MRQVFLFLYSILVLLALSACSGGEKADDNTTDSTVYVSITPPETPISIANRTLFALAGICHEEDRLLTVKLTDVSGTSTSAQATCNSDGNWSVQVNADTLNDGELAILVSYEEEDGTLRSARGKVDKDTDIPRVGITDYSDIPLSAVSAYTFGGSCSDSGQPVTVELVDKNSRSVSSTAPISCTSKNTWSAQVDVSGLADGVVRITAHMEDAAGNPSDVSEQDVTRDTDVPNLKLNQHDNIFANTYRLSGYCDEEAGEITAVLTHRTDGSIARESTTCGGDNTWSLDFADVSTLGQGAIEVAISLADAVGNTISRTVVVEKSSSVTRVGIDAASIVNSGNAGTFTIAGTCAPDGGDVTVTIGGVASTSPSVSCTDGTWTANFDLSGEPDSAELTIVADYEQSGAVAPQARGTTYKDTELPAVEIVDPTPITSQTMGRYQLGGTCGEGGRAVTLQLRDHLDVAASIARQPVCTNAGEWFLEVDTAMLADGAVALTARHSDFAGNIGEHTPSPIIKDTSLVELTLQAPPILFSTVARYRFGGTCSDDGQEVEVAVVDGAGNTKEPAGAVLCGHDTSNVWWAEVDASELSDGAITVTATHQDAAGNPLNQQRDDGVIKDTVLPHLTVVGNNIATEDTANYGISGECSEPDTPIAIELRDSAAPPNGASLSPTCSSGSWTARVNVEDFKDGYVFISATHSDPAGNDKMVSLRTLKDTIPLDLTIDGDPPPPITLNILSAYRITGTCSEVGRAVAIEVRDSAATPHNVLPTPATCTDQSKWSIEINATGLDDGDITILATHTDLLGASLERSKNVLKDIVPPTLTMDTPGNILAETDDGDYPLQGTCDENDAVITLVVDDDDPATNAVTSSPRCTGNAWTARLDLSGLKDSTLQIAANYEDSVGNSKEISATVDKDTQKPILSANTPSHIFPGTASAYNLSGSCSEIGQTVSITFTDATSLELATTSQCLQNGALGQWSVVNFNVSTLAVGNVFIAIAQSDVLGNTGTTSYDVQKSDSEVRVTVNSIPIINKSNEASYTLQGNCSPVGGILTVSVGGKAPTDGQASCSSETWQATFDFTTGTLVPDGTTTVLVDYSLGDSNAPQVRHPDVIKDTQIPSVVIVTTANILTATYTAYPVTGTCSEQGQEITVVLEDKNATSADPQYQPHCNSGNWMTVVDTTNLLDGAVTIEATHADLAGNTASADSVLVTRDTIVPVVQITSADDINASTGQATYPVSGTCDEAGQTVTVRVGTLSGTTLCTLASSMLTWSLQFDVTGLPQGDIEIAADMDDPLLNPAQTAVRTINKDTNLPQITIVASHINQATNAVNYQVSGGM